MYALAEPAAQSSVAPIAMARSSTSKVTLPAFMRYCFDEVDTLKAETAEAVAYSAEHGILFYQAIAAIYHGWTLVKTGSEQSGVAQMRAGIEGMRATGAEVLMPAFYVLLADGLACTGAFDEAHEFVERSVITGQRGGERNVESDAWRLKGALLLAQPHPDPAGAAEAFKTSIAIAREQESLAWELRGATGLAQLWSNQGLTSEAHNLLLPICMKFAGEPDVPILRRARSMIAQLG